MPVPQMSADRLQAVLSGLRRAREIEYPRLANIRSYLLDQATDIYVPKKANAEYKLLVEQSKFNLMPMVVSTLAQALKVDGYRPMGPNGRAPSSENSPIWDAVWQPNRMDARQSSLYRASASYAYGYALVLPGDPAPVITPYSPFRMTAIYSDPVNDLWPAYAMSVDHADALTGSNPSADPARPLIDPLVEAVVGPVNVRVYDEDWVYTISVPPASRANAPGELITAELHGLGHVPVVRFPDSEDLDGLCLGKVEPLIPIQRQIVQTTFSLLMAQQYGAFRQRWATGMAIEEDDDGKPLEPWNSAVDSVWQNESPDGKFGDFAETDLGGYLNSRDKAILFVAAAGKVPPHDLIIGAGISNISADALVALESAHRADVDDHQTTFGESIEQMLRLAGLAMKTPEGRKAWEDDSAQVVWRDTTPRSLAQIADALGKLAVQLEIPPEALWERIPGVTDQDIARWKELKAEKRRQDAEAFETLVDAEADDDGEIVPPPTAEPEPAAATANGTGG